MSSTLHHRICPLCEASCGLQIQVEGEAIVSIKGDPADVLSRGYICPKAVALKDLHSDKDRLRTPMIRRDGTLVPASWDEAWLAIAQGLQRVVAQHGHQSLGISIGNPASHKLGILSYLGKLIAALKSKHIYSASTLDQMPRHLCSGFLYGHWMSVPIPDIERTQLLIVIGGNPVVSNGSMWTVPDFRGKVKALQERGGKLIVIDPRRTETAAIADQHYFIRPGSDPYLLAAMVQTLFADHVPGTTTAEPYISGIHEIAPLVAEWTPERVALICGIDAQTIRSLAHQLCDTARAAIYGRIGVTTQEHGTLNTWLIDVLNILSGHFDKPGGTLFACSAAFASNTIGPSGKGKGVRTGRFHSRVSQAPEVMGEMPTSCLTEEITTPGEGQLRALITVASNPVLSAPASDQLDQALEQLDFMLSIDIYCNETTRHADVILPSPSPLEDVHYDIPFPQMSYRNHARFSPAIFAMAAGQQADWEILLRLTHLLGQLPQQPDLSPSTASLDEALFAQEAEQLFGPHAPGVLKATAQWTGPLRKLDVALRSGPYGDMFGQRPDGLHLRRLVEANSTGGIDLGALQPRLPAMLRTPSGTLELAHPTLLSALQALRDPAPQDPSTMLLIGRREVRSNNSWMHNLHTLAKGPERCVLLVHPDDAQRLGMSEGSQAHLSTAQGELTAPVHVSDEVMPGIVSLPHGWGHAAPGTQLGLASQRPGVNMNRLLSTQTRDPLSGTAVLNGIPVRVKAVDSLLTPPV